MASSPPNVLVVRHAVPGDVLSNKASVKFPPGTPGGIPNLKIKRAYYLTFVEDSNQLHFRVYHILRAKEDGDAISFDLGHSFVTEVAKPINMSGRPYIYLTVAALGLQQIGPGTLVNIQPSLNALTGGQ